MRTHLEASDELFRAFDQEATRRRSRTPDLIQLKEQFWIILDCDLIL